MFKNHMKKIIAISIAAFTLSVFAASKAPSSDTYYIEQYTYGLLVILNSWIMPDVSQTTANLQSSFGSQANVYLNNYSTQVSLLPKLLSGFYGQGVTSATVPYANDMTYGTLLGQPLLTPDPRTNTNPALNYISNVAGLNLTHAIPSATWTGTDYDKIKYINFYTTVSSIQSYNAFVLSQLYADNVTTSNTPKYTDAQNQLIKQASSSDWFTQVASENIGIILRQMLMYNSQIYVLLSELVQTQKQMLATLAMTNTLIVIGDSFTENQLIQKARVTTGQ